MSQNWAFSVGSRQRQEPGLGSVGIRCFLLSAQRAANWLAEKLAWEGHCGEQGTLRYSSGRLDGVGTKT